MKRVLCVSWLSLLFATVALAQTPNESKPARTCLLGAEYPRVTADSRGIFQFTTSLCKWLYSASSRLI